MKKLQISVVIMIALFSASIAFSQDNEGKFQGFYGTDFYTLYVDANGPKEQDHQYFNVRLHQTEVWNILGVPQRHVLDQYDLYVTDAGIFVVYYYDGFSNVMLGIPYHMY
jgi:hypothetical protein